jgi:TPR repeat protein
MIKRYLPLLFVLLVVIATVVVFLLYREPETPSTLPAVSADPPAQATGADGVREFRVQSEEEYQHALEALGTSNEEIEAWARSRGFPPATYTSTPGTPLERAYRREKDATLLELAEGGDPWAMQFLAARIMPEMPLEAVHWYRRAVVHGSAYSAYKLGNLYQEVARWIAINQDDRDEVVEIARREDPLAYSSLGWLLVGEYEAGLPPGSMSATLAGFREADEGITQSCIRAAGFLAEIRAEREALGISVPDHKPPLAIDLPAEEIAGYCAPDVFPRADFSGCETVRLVGEAGAVTGHRCR